MNAAAKPDILSASEMRVDNLQHAALDTNDPARMGGGNVEEQGPVQSHWSGVALSAVIVSSLVGCGGSTTCGQIRYRARTKPVVVLTGYKAIAPEYNPGTGDYRLR